MYVGRYRTRDGWRLKEPVVTDVINRTCHVIVHKLTRASFRIFFPTQIRKRKRTVNNVNKN